MWEYSDSELDDDMVRRCSYCGRFCSQSDIVDENGLCRKCSEELDHCSNHSSDVTSAASETVIPDEESMSSSPDGEANSPNPSQINANRRDDGSDSGLCARCWTHPPTKLLYNTPICDGCFHVAQEKRVSWHILNDYDRNSEHSLADIHQKEHTKGTKV